MGHPDWTHEAAGCLKRCAVEIERLKAENAGLRSALQQIEKHDWYWGAPWIPEKGHNTRHHGFWGKLAAAALGQTSSEKP